MKKTVVIYHRADFDGIFCCEIARKHLGELAEYIGWDYGDPLPVVPPEVDTIYMLDISIEGMMDDKRLVWIDHHKSAIEKYAPIIIVGYRLDGVAACRLTWQWFSHQAQGFDPHRIQLDPELPDKVDYVNRNVSEPLAVRLAGEYDIWDKRDPRAELFQHGLRSCELKTAWWGQLLSEDSLYCEAGVNFLLEAGRAIQYAKTQENESIINAYGFDVEFEGLKFLACNHARFNSHLFLAGTKPEHDALLGFNWDGKRWRVSLYHAPGKEHHDLSKIATKYGGGGHKGACGFRADSLPFLWSAHH